MDNYYENSIFRTRNKHRIQFVLIGPGRAFPNRGRTVYKLRIEANGGEHYSQIGPSTDCVVLPNYIDKINDENAKDIFTERQYSRIQKFELPCVKLSYIDACIEADRLLLLDGFLIETPWKTSTDLSKSDSSEEEEDEEIVGDISLDVSDHMSVVGIANVDEERDCEELNTSTSSSSGYESPTLSLSTSPRDDILLIPKHQPAVRGEESQLNLTQIQIIPPPATLHCPANTSCSVPLKSSHTITTASTSTIVSDIHNSMSMFSA